MGKANGKKGGGLKIILIIVGVLLVIGIVGSVMGGGDDDKDKVKKVTEEKDSKDKADEKEEKKEEKKVEKKEPDLFKVGETAELNDVTVKFNKVTESKGGDMNKPDEGNIYVLANFTITNNTKENLDMSTIMSFDTYQDDTGTDLSLGALMEKGKAAQLDGSIAPGKKMEGVVGYEVPAGYKKLEIHVKPDALANDAIKFIYEK